MAIQYLTRNGIGLLRRDVRKEMLYELGGMHVTAANVMRIYNVVLPLSAVLGSRQCLLGWLQPAFPGSAWHLDAIRN